MSELCRDCRAWQKEDGRIGPRQYDMGDCRLNAPVAVEEGPYSRQWPRTKETGWCMKFISCVPPTPQGAGENLPTPKSKGRKE